MLELDYTNQGRRPSPQQILSDWKKAGRPDDFEVLYGETYARFTLVNGRWDSSGNGCQGVKRGAVENLLLLEQRKAIKK